MVVGHLRSDHPAHHSNHLRVRGTDGGELVRMLGNWECLVFRHAGHLLHNRHPSSASCRSPSIGHRHCPPTSRLYPLLVAVPARLRHGQRSPCVPRLLQLPYSVQILDRRSLWLKNRKHHTLVGRLSRPTSFFKKITQTSNWPALLRPR